MSIRTLCTAPHQMLRSPAKAVERFTDELQTLADDLIETMYANAGIGLAAPQIGRLIQVFVANPSRQPGRELVIVNPTVRVLNGQTVVTEGCLSVPNVWGRVKRAACVHVQGQDPRGTPIDLEAGGLLAVVLQHEFDHLHGKLFIDRLSWPQRLRVHARLAMRACA